MACINKPTMYPFWSIVCLLFLLTRPATMQSQNHAANKAEDIMSALKPKDQSITLDGLKFHYREWGRLDAPPLVILHGLTGHAWEFDSVAQNLADVFHVLVLNQRGHGSSSWAEQYSPQLMAEDIAAFADALKLEHIRLVGHSMGGVNGWFFAANYPKRIQQLVILDINPDVITSLEIADSWITYLTTQADLRYNDPQEAVNGYLEGYTGSQHQQLRDFVLNNLISSNAVWRWRFDARGLVQWIQQAFSQKEEHWSALQSITCPTLVIRASESSFTTNQDMQRMMQNISFSRYIEIANSGHDIHIDQLDLLLSELSDFLAE